MLKRNGKLGIGVAVFEPGAFQYQKGDLPTVPAGPGLPAADGICRNLHIFDDAGVL